MYIFFCEIASRCYLTSRQYNIDICKSIISSHRIGGREELFDKMMNKLILPSNVPYHWVSRVLLLVSVNGVSN